MNAQLKNVLVAASMIVATQAIADVTFFERPGFKGRSFSATRDVRNLERNGFNDRASSAVVTGGRWERWEVCEHARYEGECVVLRPGRYPSLAAIGLNNQISSARPISRRELSENPRYASYGDDAPDFRRVRNERLYEAEVVATRAVYGPKEQRCWVEKEQVVEARNDNSVPGTIAGAVIGGILGHQIGGGRGKDLATIGGAVAGGYAGNRIGQNSGGQQVVTRDVQRCADVPNRSKPEYWDVTYLYRDQEHHVQMTAHPGPTVTVNGRGEPRHE